MQKQTYSFQTLGQFSKYLYLNTNENIMVFKSKLETCWLTCQRR